MTGRVNVGLTSIGRPSGRFYGRRRATGATRAAGLTEYTEEAL